MNIFKAKADSKPKNVMSQPSSSWTYRQNFSACFNKGRIMMNEMADTAETFYVSLNPNDVKLLITVLVGAGLVRRVEQETVKQPAVKTDPKTDKPQLLPKMPVPGHCFNT